ncbi:MAG: hypothetical protein P4L40_04255 [Terracidiphilus sp.]|nr:hypothetical protein [Terracidiphilus sp.]
MACEVLSAGSDKSFRVFHTALDRQNRELSQGVCVCEACVRACVRACVCVCVCVCMCVCVSV